MCRAFRLALILSCYLSVILLKIMNTPAAMLSAPIAMKMALTASQYAAMKSAATTIMNRIASITTAF